MIEFCCAVAVICCFIVMCIQQKRINDLSKAVGILIVHDENNQKLWSNQISINEGDQRLWTNQISVNRKIRSHSSDTIKKVEDTCRAMISSYNTDKHTYEQYKDSDNEEKQEWAEQAKMRANKTASTYNNYILKNSYVWKDNVPDDIYMTLEFID